MSDTERETLIGLKAACDGEDSRSHEIWVWDAVRELSDALNWTVGPEARVAARIIAHHGSARIEVERDRVAGPRIALERMAKIIEEHHKAADDKAVAGVDTLIVSQRFVREAKASLVLAMEALND